MNTDSHRFPYRARAYELDIWSDIDLPEFLPAEGGIDATVILENQPRALDCTSPQWKLEPDVAECCFPRVGRFRITGGVEIRVTPVPEVMPGMIRLYVEGMMMAILLHQRGYFVLHASVVEIDGCGVAFVGPVGAGKSSLAMALHSLGGRVVTDDNAAVRVENGIPLVLPAFPRVKLYPDIAAALGIDQKSLNDLHKSQVKKTRSVDDGFARAPIPLHRIYALSREACSIAKLSRPQAAIELIKHSIPARWGLAGTPEQLWQCAWFSGTVPIYRLRTFDTPASLADVARSVEAHLLSPAPGRPVPDRSIIVVNAG